MLRGAAGRRARTRDELRSRLVMPQGGAHAQTRRHLTSRPGPAPGRRGRGGRPGRRRFTATGAGRPCGHHALVQLRPRRQGRHRGRLGPHGLQQRLVAPTTTSTCRSSPATPRTTSTSGCSRWGGVPEGGINVQQLGVNYGTATTLDAAVLAADPFVKKGYGGEIWDTILQQCATAQQAHRAARPDGADRVHVRRGGQLRHRRPGRGLGLRAARRPPLGRAARARQRRSSRTPTS